MHILRVAIWSVTGAFVVYISCVARLLSVAANGAVPEHLLETSTLVTMVFLAGGTILLAMFQLLGIGKPADRRVILAAIILGLVWLNVGPITVNR